MKFVREQSKPISGDNGLKEIRGFAERERVSQRRRAPACGAASTSLPAYVAHLLSYVDCQSSSR